jgi:lipopolysaccharide transport system permease protein
MIPSRIIKIEPQAQWKFLNLSELIEYSDLFYFMVWREVKVLYAQTILGLTWAFIQPIVQILVFSIVFGKVAQVSTDGIPYVLFSTVAIIPWTYMSSAMTQASESLIQGQSMLSKIYFPRVIYPLTPILARLIDFAISMLLIVVVLFYYQVQLTWKIALLPIFFAIMILVPAGVGFWFSALSVRFRDIKHAMPFVVRMLIYSAPILYSASSIPENWRLLYSLNPLVCVIEGFRACLLGTEIQWIYIVPGIVVVVSVAFFGLLYFKKMEVVFADVI